MTRLISAVPALRKAVWPLGMIAVWVAIAAAVAAHPGHEAPDGDSKAGVSGAGVSGSGVSGAGGAAAGQEQDTASAAGGVACKPSRAAVLVSSVTVFVLAVFVGFEIINKVPPTLHTPLMSGSNAISGITVVGAILASGSGRWDGRHAIFRPGRGAWQYRPACP